MRIARCGDELVFITEIEPNSGQEMSSELLSLPSPKSFSKSHIDLSQEDRFMNVRDSSKHCSVCQVKAQGMAFEY